MPMEGLINGTGIIQVVHLEIKFIARRGRPNTYHGHYLGAVGDRLEETDPSWVKIKHNSLECTSRKVVTDLGLMLLVSPRSVTTFLLVHSRELCLIFTQDGSVSSKRSPTAPK